MCARIKNLTGALVAAIFVSATPAASAQTASCAAPPGGRISCERRQAAVCNVLSGGQVDGSCSTPPRSMTLEELRAWILGIIFGRKDVSPREVNENPEYQRVLREGRTPQGARIGGRRVTFSLPEPSGDSSPPRVPSGPRPASPTDKPNSPLDPTNPVTPDSPRARPNVRDDRTLPPPRPNSTRNTPPRGFLSKVSRPLRAFCRGLAR